MKIIVRWIDVLFKGTRYNVWFPKERNKTVLSGNVIVNK